MSKIYLHIGTHKTGTTSIQRYLAGNAAEIHKQGLYYPNIDLVQKHPHYAHHKLSHSIAKKGQDLWDRDRIQRFIDLSVKKAKGSDVLLSAEPFYRHILAPKQVKSKYLNDQEYWEYREAYIEKTHSLLSGYDVELVLVYRRQIEYLSSLYQENVKVTSFSGTPFELYLAKRHEFDYYKQTRAWNKYFKSVKVGIYENLLENKTLIKNFLDFVLPEDKNITVASESYQNQSFHPQIIEFKRYYQNLHNSCLTPVELEKLRAMVEQDNILCPEKALSYLSSGEERMIMVANRSSNKLLQKRFFDKDQNFFPKYRQIKAGRLNPVNSLNTDLLSHFERYLSNIRNG